jgi:hypothetical protein
MSAAWTLPRILEVPIPIAIPAKRVSISLDRLSLSHIPLLIIVLYAPESTNACISVPFTLALIYSIVIVPKNSGNSSCAN